MSTVTRLLLGIAAGVALVAAAVGATVLIVSLTAGRGTVLDRMVPSDVLGYASANLDPPADQKVDLLSLSRKFPDLGTQSQINHSLDDGLKPLGLKYTSDVQPWLGAQVVVLVTGSKPDGALLIDSRDDGAAQRALTKLRTGPEGRGATWHTAQHGGVTLEIGSLKGQTAVIAYFDHTALLGSSESLADEIIDTDQGKHARLNTTAEYRTLTGRLPSSRLVTVFVSGDGLRTAAEAAGHAAAKPAGGTEVPGGLVPPVPVPSLPADSLNGYKGFAAAVSARSDGITGDFEVDIDRSKLAADQQSLFQTSARANAAMNWMPSSATAVVATTKLDGIAKAVSGAIKQQGVDTSLLDSLTGDVAVEAEGTASGSNIAFGAVIGTTKASALAAMIDSLSQGQVVTVASGGDLVIASSQDEAARLQSANSGGSRLADAPAFKKAQDYGVANPDSLLYVDAPSAFRLAGRLGLDSNSDFQQQRSRWSALEAVLITSGINSNGGSTKVRILVS